MKHFNHEKAVILANSCPPLLLEDYTRLEETVSKEFRWYLVGMTCSLAKEKAFRSNVLNNQLTREQIAKNNGCAEETMRRFMYYTNAVFRLQKNFPALVSDILAGKTRLGLKTTIFLAKLPQDDISAIIKRMETDNASIRRIISEQIKNLPICPQNFGNVRNAKYSSKSVKDMPRFNPDAQAIGLTYTIPSWINALNRIYMSGILREISIPARNTLGKELTNLKTTTEALIESIMEVLQ